MGFGETPVTVGDEVIESPFGSVTEPPPGLLIVTLTGPSAVPGATSTLIVICDELLTVMLTTVMPGRLKLTVAPGAKLIPLSTIVKSSAPWPTEVLDTL